MPFALRVSPSSASTFNRRPVFRTHRVNGGLRMRKRAVVQLRCHASACSQSGQSPALVSREEEEDDTALRFLGFISAGGEALSTVVPPSLVAGCYALAAASVCAETAHRCREHVRKNWGGNAGGGSPMQQDVLLAGGGLGSARREKAVRASRKALQRGAVKLLTTVALPTLLMHGLTHCGWDMFTNTAGITDAVSAAAGQLADALHLPHHDIAEALARAVPNIAGSFLMPSLAKPAQALVDKFLASEIHPAIDEFMSGEKSYSGPSSMRALSNGLGRSFSRLMPAAADAADWGSFSMPMEAVCRRLAVKGVALTAAAHATCGGGGGGAPHGMPSFASP